MEIIVTNSLESANTNQESDVQLLVEVQQLGDGVLRCNGHHSHTTASPLLSRAHKESALDRSFRLQETSKVPA